MRISLAVPIGIDGAGLGDLALNLLDEVFGPASDSRDGALAVVRLMLRLPRVVLPEHQDRRKRVDSILDAQRLG